MACECPTVIANVTYPEGWFLAYDPDNPETIAPDTNETINIFGCRPPFTWSMSGNGFDLDWYETEGLFNTLIADDTACGAAEIIITDNYGESVTGYVRCTNGTWVFVSDGCIIPPGDCPNLISSCDGNNKKYCCVLGKYYQVQQVSNTGSWLLWGLCPGTYEAACCEPHGDYFPCLEGSCDPVYGCDFCLINGCCKNSGYAGTPCPPACRRWCRCNLSLYYMEWKCVP
ncbi:hypothetical protein KA005_33705, partial [bacterium]|nr:hypothetical protein [bacterium]